MLLPLLQLAEGRPCLTLSDKRVTCSPFFVSVAHTPAPPKPSRLGRSLPPCAVAGSATGQAGIRLCFASLNDSMLANGAAAAAIVALGAGAVWTVVKDSENRQTVALGKVEAAVAAAEGRQTAALGKVEAALAAVEGRQIAALAAAEGRLAGTLGRIEEQLKHLQPQPAARQVQLVVWWCVCVCGWGGCPAARSQRHAVTRRVLQPFRPLLAMLQLTVHARLSTSLLPRQMQVM